MNNKDTIFELIKSNIFRLFCKPNIDKDLKLEEFLISENINIPISKITIQSTYDYLTNNRGKYCQQCGNTNKFKRFTEGYFKFCSNKCLHKWRSDNMKGDNNNSHKMSDSTRKNAHIKQSLKMKQLIAEGKWTPCITNSWARSRTDVLITQNEQIKIIKCRSTWEAYFQIKNQHCLYENIRIPYEFNKVFHNYIVDFVDINKKILYEIKPESEKQNNLNIIKFNAATKWAKDNDYNFIVISNDWFKCNYNPIILEGQPSKERILRLLNQFA